MEDSNPSLGLESSTHRRKGRSLPILPTGHFLRCDSALAATLFVRADVRPSLSILDAFAATALLVTRFWECLLDMASFSFLTHVPYGEVSVPTVPRSSPPRPAGRNITAIDPLVGP